MSSGLVLFPFSDCVVTLQAASAPMVSFDADPSSMWSLVLTNPDGHFSEPDAEYVHWFM